MRKTKYFIILAAALSLASCTDKEPLKNLPEGKATLRMGFVSELPGTRSFGPTASISELHVIVFDESGCYSESAEAENLTPGQGADGRETKFDVTLTATSNPVTLHFIAGADPGNIPFGVESEILGAITTSGGGDAYWQRIDLADGIPSDGTTPATLKRIPLVRNFAAISVTSTATGFTFSGYALTNIPDRGSVAPHTASGGFAPFTGETCPSYSSLNASGYHGWTPAGTVLTNTDGASLSFTTGTTYIYEHPYTGNKDTYTSIIIKGRPDGTAADTYYKLDFVRTLPGGSVEYYDIIRNISYSVTIESVSGAGYATAQEAMDSPAGNNLAGSINTDGMNNISDGTGQLFVSDTSLEFVTADPLTLKYKWIPNLISSPNVTRNGLVTVSAPEGNVLAGAASVSTTDTDGWRTVTLTPKAIGNLIRRQDITLTTNTGLTKTIHLTSRPKYNMTVSVSPGTVAAAIGEPVTISVTIPAGIGRSLFPLNFTVSTDNNTLYPDPSTESMSMVIETPKYGFSKTVNWTDYESYTESSDTYTFACRMLTNTTASATTVRVNEQHFNEGTATFNN